MGDNVMVPALLPQEVEVAQRRFGTEQDNHIGIAWDRLSGSHPLKGDTGFLFQGVGIVEVRHAGEHRSDNPQRPACWP